MASSGLTSSCRSHQNTGPTYFRCECIRREAKKSNCAWERRRQTSSPPCYSQSLNHGQTENLSILFAFLNYAPTLSRISAPPGTTLLFLQLPPTQKEAQPAHSRCPSTPLFPAHVGRGLMEFMTSTRGRAGASATASPIPSPLHPHTFQMCWHHRQRLDAFDDSRRVCQDKRTALSQAFKTGLETIPCPLSTGIVHPLFLS